MWRQTLHVLMVEDDPDYLALARAWLASRPAAKFRVESAATLATGLARMAKGGLDVILLDLGLPDSRGAATFEAVRAQSSDIPIVLLTASDEEGLSLELVDAGAQDYLVKDRCDGATLERSLLHSILRSQRESSRLGNFGACESLAGSDVSQG